MTHSTSAGLRYFYTAEFYDFLHRRYHMLHEFGVENPYIEPDRTQILRETIMAHLDTFKTPFLMECGVNDDPGACQMLATGLSYVKNPFIYLSYPKTGHPISGPKLQLAHDRWIINWFDYWLLGKPSKQITNALQP